MSYEAGSKECRNLIDAKESLLSAMESLSEIIGTENLQLQLKEIYNSQPKQESDGYKMASLEPALAVLRDYVSNQLGHNYWKCNQGNFFEAYHPYRIHADTSADEHNHQTIVFPLDWSYNDDA